MKELQLTEMEIELLLQTLYSSNGCQRGCILPHMEESNDDCDMCEYPNIIYAIESKLEKLQEEE